MWQQWFTDPSFRYATGDRLTVLKFEASQRQGMTGPQRRDEILDWLERSRRPGFDNWLAAEASAAFRRAAVELRMDRDYQADEIARERQAFAQEGETFARERDAFAAHNADLRAAKQRSEERTAEAQAALRDIQASRVWRMRNRLVSFPPLEWLSRT